MGKISYTLTQEDCRDYVKSQYKIPRIKKFIMKAYIPFWIIGSVCFVIFLLPLFINLFTGLKYLMSEGGMSFLKALTDFQMVEFYKSGLMYFVSNILPFIFIWLAVFFSSWYLGACDAFSLYSKRVFKLLEGRALEAEIEVQEGGLSMTGKTLSSFIEWSGIVDIHSTPNTFLIFVSDYQAVIVPKRAFETPEKADEFFNFVDEKVKAAKTTQE